MRKALFLIVLLGVAATISWQQTRSQADTHDVTIAISPTITQERKVTVQTTTESVFIPYWEIPQNSVELRPYHKLYYFGVAPDDDGSVKDDAGYQSISEFIENTPSSKKRYLTVRMLNTEINSAILDSTDAQNKLISETVALVGQYKFDGVVLDLELSVLPLSGTSSDITAFVTRFADSIHTEDYEMLMTLYGDTFYRARPYDVEALGKVVDGILIMAYDFHKSRGEPGPNFPLTRRSVSEGSQVYPYSFQDMITDFQNVVESEKLTVLFGMYGYGWTLGPQGLPLKAAKAIPLYQIEEGYKDCERIIDPDSIRDPEKKSGSSITMGDTACYIFVNSTSQEKVIFYTDDEGYSHELWYEDEESVQVKKEYLKEQGIGSMGYWVWGYY